MPKVGVVMDSIESINLKKDSTLAMIRAVQLRGWSVHYMEQSDLYFREDRPWAFTRRLNLAPEVIADLQSALSNPLWYELQGTVTEPLGEFDIILMRKDPPFDLEYVYTTYLLERAEQEGALVVNRPQSLRDCNEKFFATEFPECTPPLVISRRDDVLREFHREQGDVIFKPLDGMGGESIFRVSKGDPNLSVVIETLTRHGSRQIMGQKYIPEIADGDKRILMIGGQALPYALARIPAAGEARGNLAAGGRGVGRELTPRDRWICDQVGPKLEEKGLLFVGIDIIGDYLTEVNVTCPTCVRELDAAFDLDIAGQLMDAIERRL
ncbi:MAG: glutathione synthase [Pseudomonadales bacterium]|jgi:glutathione synthase